MYSFEDRIKAVQLYINPGCDEVVVLRTLGYPSPNALRQWYREYKQTGTLHLKVKRNIQYTAKKIKVAVEYCNKHGGSLIGTCRALGYPDRNILSLWVRATHINACKELANHCKSGRELVRCSKEQKQAAVEAWMSGTPDYKIAAQYGVSKATVYTWKKKLLGKVPIRMKKKGNSSLSEELPSCKEELKSEIKSLQVEIDHLRMERDVLEKAAEIVKKDEASICRI